MVQVSRYWNAKESLWTSSLKGLLSEADAINQERTPHCMADTRLVLSGLPAASALSLSD